MSEVINDYKTLCQLKFEENIVVTKYQSNKTGLKVCICEKEGPIVSGFLIFATEAHDDDGLPHALEHLTLMGSELYPFKAVLPHLSYRCLATGINAFTSTDHTSYMMNTIGYEGFLNLLPIYIDHVLYPMLTDEAFLTEIHHINGEGKDAGVLYCEMEACENIGDNLCYLETVRSVFPGKCGYKSETGGILKNLRENITNEKIREYHRQFYRSENLCIIITGKINASDVFKALLPVEERIIQKGPFPEFTRPWQNSVPPLTEPVLKIVPYPCDDNEQGIVYIALRGPLVKEIEECVALELLFEYLDKTSVSPLQREFVQIKDPYCSNVYAFLMEFSQTVILFYFECVLKVHLNNIKPRLLEVLSKLATGEEEFDMKRISASIHNSKLDILNDIERANCYTFLKNTIIDFLYGKMVDEFERRMQIMDLYNKLAKKDMKYWQNLLRKYLLVENIVTIIGEPNPELKEKLMKEEEMRISKQKEHLGEDGLKAKDELFQAARKLNDIKPPKELLQSVPVPSMDKIKFHSIRRLTNCKEDLTFDPVLQEMPYSFHLDDINTKFVTMKVIMDSASVPLKLRFYLPLFVRLITELPIERNGELISYEEVVAKLDADLLEKYCFLGLTMSCGFSPSSYAQLVSFYLKVEQEKYQKGIQWIHQLLYKTKFTADRIQVLVKKLLKRTAKLKQMGYCLLHCLKNNILFKESSNYSCCSILKQNAFLKRIEKLLESNPDEVINDLEELRNLLAQPRNILVHMAANLNSLGENLLSDWKNVVENSERVNSEPFLRHKIMACDEHLLPLETSVSQSCILGIGSVDSSYMTQATRCIVSSKHPDYPALLVLFSYFNQQEGPLWSIIRGTGFSYYFYIDLEEDSGLINFSLSRCTSMIAACKETKKYIDNLFNGKEQWDQLLFESSRSCLVNEIIQSSEASVTYVSIQSLKSYYEDVDLDFIRKTLLSQIFKVNIEDLQSVGTKYLLPLFDPNSSSCAICCHTSKVEELVTGFKEMGHNLNIIKDLDNCKFSQIEDEMTLREC